MKYDVFISYSRQDYVDEHEVVKADSPVKAILDFLDAHQISYWFDKEGIYCGSEFVEVIANAISDSKMMLFISSEHSNESIYTAGEIFEAIENNKLIIPIKIDASKYSKKFKILLNPLDYIDFSKIDAFAKLLKTIKKEKVRIAQIDSDEIFVPKVLKTQSQTQFEKHEINVSQKQKQLLNASLESSNKKFGQVDVSSKLSFDVVLKNYGVAKLLVAKVAKETCGLSLKEAKYVVDNCPIKLKHSVGMEEAVIIKMALEKVGAKVILENNNKEFGQVDVSSKLSFDVVLKNYGVAKLLVAKVAKETCGLSLKEAKYVVDNCPIKLKHSVGMEEAVIIKMALEKVGAKVILESNNKKFGQKRVCPNQSFDVILKNYGVAKLLVVKVVMNSCGLSLNDAKYVVDNCPMILKKSLGKAEAEALKTVLEEVGAKVTIVG